MRRCRTLFDMVNQSPVPRPRPARAPSVFFLYLQMNGRDRAPHGPYPPLLELAIEHAENGGVLRPGEDEERPSVDVLAHADAVRVDAGTGEPLGEVPAIDRRQRVVEGGARQR